MNELTKPCFWCGKEQPVSEREYNNRLYFPMCHGCRILAAKPAASYETRFVKKSDAAELVNLYHLARTALAGDRATRYDRMCWAAKWFAKEHPYVTSTGAYKDLDGLLA